MGKYHSITVDEKTYNNLKNIAEKLNISVPDLLRIIAGTHPIIKILADNTEEYHKKIIEIIRMTLKTAVTGHSVTSFTQISSQQQTISSQAQTTSVQDMPYDVRLKRAAKYANKILEKNNKITTKELEKVCKKFNVDFWDLVQELGLYEKEKGVWIPT